MNWIRQSIGALSTRVSSGGTPSRARPEYFCASDQGHFWVKSKELLDCGIHDTEEKISDLGLEKSAAKYFPAEAVLVAMYGANVGQLGWLAKPATVNQAICGIITDEKKLHWRFLYYVLLATRPDLIVKAQGAAQQNLNEDSIRSFEILVPAVEEQRRIAGILSAYDDLIENCQRRIRILEEMARSLYREWFVHFRYPGHESVPLVDSPLGPIPTGWRVLPFTDIADVLSGGTPKTDIPEYWDGTIPWFTPRDAPNAFYVEEAQKQITELGLSKCASALYGPETIFITARGTVGKVAMAGVPMAMNQSCYALRGKGNVSQCFLFLLTLHQIEYLKTNTGGATFDTIVVDTFRRMSVVEPSPSVVRHFTELTEGVFGEVKFLLRQVRNLRQTRDLLLPKLLRDPDTD